MGRIGSCLIVSAYRAAISLTVAEVCALFRIFLYLTLLAQNHDLSSGIVGPTV